LSDPNQENAEKARGLVPSAVIYDDLQALLSSGVQAVIIASPDHLHPGQLRMAIEAGLHVLVEKPLAVHGQGLAHVHEAFKLAQAKKLVISSCHVRRFDPPYRWLRDNLADLIERFGSLVHVTLDFSYHRPSDGWKHERSLLLDHWGHEVDFLRFLLSDRPLMAVCQHDSYDSYAVAGQIGNDVGFQCLGTRRLYEGIFAEEVRLRFDQGTVTLNTMTGRLIESDHDSVLDTLDEVQPTDHAARLRGVMANFAEAIGGRPCYLTPDDILVNTVSGIELVQEDSFFYQPGEPIELSSPAR
jgi:predicted dehydrogenase